jgi:hypothetical protein
MEEIGVTLSMMRNLENRAPRWSGHTERMEEEILPKRYTPTTLVTTMSRRRRKRKKTETYI